MFGTSKIFIHGRFHKFIRAGQKNFKEEYMHLPSIYLFGFPILIGLSTFGFGFLNKPITCEDKVLNNNFRDSMFWTPL